MLQASTLGDLLRNAARSAPDAPAFLHRGRILSYREWNDGADRLAARLAAGGLRQGDVLALLLPSLPLYLVAYLAAARLGAITTGINARYRRAEITHILQHSGAHTLLAVEAERDVSFRRIVEEARPNLPQLSDYLWLEAAKLDLSTQEIVAELGRGVSGTPDFPVHEEDLATIVFTSGTTGVPKGACYSHRSLLALAEIDTRRYRGGEIPFRKHLSAGLSFAHLGTMARIALQIGHLGMSILHDAFDPALVLETIERERLVHLGGFPTQMVVLLEHPDRERRDLSSLRSILLGGAPSSPELIRRIAATFDATISVRYSSTEVGIATASLPEDRPEVLATTVGKPSEGVELRIVTPANEALAAGEVGEVVVRSPATMRGYWRAPELTAKVIDAQGWVHTGDLGFLDSDGYLHLKGRESEMYIRGGYNVYPSEVENVLARHPKIARAAVLGCEDATFGEVGCAFVVARNRHDPPTLGELRAFVGEELASFKRPDRLQVVDDLPLTPMFKVDKRALRAQLDRG